MLNCFMPVAFQRAKAGRWLLDSGIQEPSGGVARFYRSEINRNKAVSTEITGYFASGLAYLFHITGDEEYLDRARKAAGFLLDHGWNAELQTFPFEHPSPSPESEHHAYFFDCGIIIRGLLAVWRNVQNDERLLDVASAAAHGMIANFHSGVDYHPILELPARKPAPRSPKWSRSPGCYQLKSALAWWELAEVTGDDALRDAYFDMVCSALASHTTYLPGSEDRHEVMDRLHPYSYFLEGLTPVLDRPECQAAYFQGLCTISRYLKEIAPCFARSDVYAQLLRARLYAPSLDAAAAAEEAETLAGFQAASEDPRIDGGFLFGRRDGEVSPHVNPVSTVFALQALEMWKERQLLNDPEGKRPRHEMLI
jgi:hypothetical protein